MATKTLTILEEVYHELVKLKKEDESFSEELQRLLQQKGKISECAGLWSWMSKKESAGIEKAIQKRRELSEKAKKEKGVA